MNSDQMRKLAALLDDARKALLALADTQDSVQIDNSMPKDIDDLQLSGRASNALIGNGIFTVATLLLYSPDELLKLRNFGVWSLHDIRSNLGKHGLCLKNDRVWGGNGHV